MKYGVMIASLKLAGVEAEDNLKFVKEKLESVGLENIYDIVRKNWNEDQRYYKDLELKEDEDEVNVPENYEFNDHRPNCCNRPLITETKICPYCHRKFESLGSKVIKAAKKKDKDEDIQISDAQLKREKKTADFYIPY